MKNESDAAYLIRREKKRRKSYETRIRNRRRRQLLAAVGLGVIVGAVVLWLVIERIR